MSREMSIEEFNKMIDVVLARRNPKELIYMRSLCVRALCNNSLEFEHKHKHTRRALRRIDDVLGVFRI